MQRGRLPDGMIGEQAEAEPSRAVALAELFAPLDHLLRSGGDPRLQIDPKTGANLYGCRPVPDPELLSFGSSTASSVSQRAYAQLAEARDALMRAAITVGVDSAFDLRIEQMREELRTCLGLTSQDADVVFSPSGTDAQLHALFLARARLGPSLTTIVVAADQTGNGTRHTARGRHFSERTAH